MGRELRQRQANVSVQEDLGPEPLGRSGMHPFKVSTCISLIVAFNILSALCLYCLHHFFATCCLCDFTRHAFCCLCVIRCNPHLITCSPVPLHTVALTKTHVHKHTNAYTHTRTHTQVVGSISPYPTDHVELNFITLQVCTLLHY
jgi:hypothetical protein